MPIDRNKPNNGRPVMPTLASTRTSRTPVTPRLAASSNAPSAKRSDRSDTSSVTPYVTQKTDTQSTPAKPYLANNVTPRSSSRKSRIGVSSGQSTPNGTPTSTRSGPSRPASTVDGQKKERSSNVGGLGIRVDQTSTASNKPGSTLNIGGHFTRTPSRPSSVVSGTGKAEPTARATSPRFFHANEVRGTQQHQPKPQTLRKTPTFFYANGTEEPRQSRRVSPSLSATSKTKDQPPQSPQFFHAGSRPASRTQNSVLTPPLSATSPETDSLAALAQRGFFSRPLSPEKGAIHLSYRKGASQLITPRASALSLYPESGTENILATKSEASLPKRKLSIGTGATYTSHRRSISISSLESANSPQQRLPQLNEIEATPKAHGKANIEAFQPLSPGYAASNESTPPQPQSAAEVFSPLPQSPTKAVSAQTNLQKMNELAANARRERKVLDLEISNSSLLAINRQLEREVRKQKAELRRYRRLTRAGRISSGSAFRSSMGGEEILDEAAELDSFVGSDEEADLDRLDEEEEEEDLSSSLSETTTDEELMSPTTLAERDKKRIAKDEKRLQLDLSKHRELLVDSQKMNQSLKRCLGWTEELIKEGRKALEYQVRVSDVKIGGRILEAEELEGGDAFNMETSSDEDATIGQGGSLLAPWTPDGADERPRRESDLSDMIDFSKADRDSGIDLDGLPPSLRSLLSPMEEHGYHPLS